MRTATAIPTPPPQHYTGRDNFTLQINQDQVDALVQPVPTYRPDHLYTVPITAPGGPLAFGAGDDGTYDNAGQYIVTITVPGASSVPVGGLIPWHPRYHASFSGAPSSLTASVDLADGHFDLSAGDMHFGARGPSLALDHTYDSLLAQAGLTTTVGAGWVDSLTPSMGGVLTGTVVYTDENGTVWQLPYSGTITATAPYTSYQIPPGQPWQLTTSPTGTVGYTLTDFLDGSSLTFDARGNVIAMTDAYSNSNVVSPGPSGPLTITNSGGRQLGFVYGSNGLLSEAKSYNWIKSGSSGSGQHVAYGYNSTGQLTSQTWGAGTGDAVSASYGYSGTQLVTVTTPGHHAWSIGWDAQGRVSSLSSPPDGATPAYTTTFTYSPAQTQVIEGAGSAQPVTTTYGLSAQGEPITLTNALGYSSTATYDQDHDVLTSTDERGNQTVNSYLYAGANGYSGPLGPNGTVGLITQTVQPPIAAYTFTNSLSPVITRFYYSPTYDLTGTVGAEGGVTLYGYDAHHSVITTTQLLTDTPGSFCQHIARHHGGPAPAPVITRPDVGSNCTYLFGWRASVNQLDQYGEVIGQTDGRGVSAPTTSSALDNPLAAPPAVTLAANAAQYTRHYSYRGLGDLIAAGTPPISTISGTVSSSGPITTSYGYNYDGLRTNVYPPNGGSISNNFNHLGQWIKTTGQSVALVGGGSGAPVVQPTYDGDGNMVRLQDALGEATTWSYDPQGRVISSTNPVGSQTLYTYGAITLSSLRDPAGNLTSFGYDAASQLITQSDPAAPSFVTQYGYDPVGNTTAITTPLDYNAPGAASVQTRQFDALNELSSATIAGTGELTPTTAQTTHLAYDHVGGLEQAQAPNGDVSYQTLDKAERATESDLYPSAVSNPDNPPPTARQVSAYDAADNLVERIDFTLYDHQMTYDGANRLSQRQDCFGTCPLNGAIITTPAYDPNGNTVALTRMEPSGAVITATASYNANDWLTRQSDAQGTTTYGYDQAGRPRTQSLLNGAGLLSSAVNAAGWITALTDTVTDTTPTTTTSSSTSLFTYTLDGLPLTDTLPGFQGVVTETRSYDADNRSTCLTAAGPRTAQVPLAEGFSYTFSAQGVITGITAQTSAAACSSSGEAPAVIAVHDALGRLTGTTNGSWTYDGNGNLQTQVLTQSGQGVPLVYNYANADGSEPAGWLPNELVSTTYGTKTGQLAEAFDYDTSGNTTAITLGAYGTQPQITQTLTYNAQGRLSGVTTSDGRTIAMGYNAAGLRATLAVTDAHPTYGTAASFSECLLYRGDRVGQVAVLEGTSSFTETFLYRPDGSPLELLYQPQGQATQRFSYIVDGQHNVVALVNSLGAVVDQYSYDLWGNPTNVDPVTGIAEGVPQPLRYRGYWYDGWYDGAGDWVRGIYASDESRPLPWYWLTTRAYDPTLKRFLQPDPSAQDGVRSYAYAHDDPVDLADPSGLAGGPIEGPIEPIGPAPEPGEPPLASPTLDVATSSSSVLASYDPVAFVQLEMFPTASELGIVSDDTAASIAEERVGGLKRGPKPKPFGPHNETIARRIAELEAQGMTLLNGGPRTEESIDMEFPNPVKSPRRPDITMRDVNGALYREQVGRTNANGEPVSREIDALRDLVTQLRTPIYFTPYDLEVPLGSAYLAYLPPDYSAGS